MKKITILLSALLALSFIGCKSNNTPEQVVLNFYQATQENDFHQALNYTNLAQEEQEQVIQVLDQMGMVIHSYNVIESNIDEGDSTAVVTLHLVTSNAYNPDTVGNDLDIPCVKVGGDWKVKFI
jgi:hypothetical protein